MADINGIEVKRTSLTASTVQAIVFDEHIQNVSLALMTSGAKVSYLINDDIVTIDDTDSNYLDDDSFLTEVNIAKDFQIEKISLISSVDCDIQWEIRK